MISSIECLDEILVLDWPCQGFCDDYMIAWGPDLIVNTSQAEQAAERAKTRAQHEAHHPGESRRCVCHSSKIRDSEYLLRCRSQVLSGLAMVMPLWAMPSRISRHHMSFGDGQVTREGVQSKLHCSSCAPDASQLPRWLRLFHLSRSIMHTEAL